MLSSHSDFDFVLFILSRILLNLQVFESFNSFSLNLVRDIYIAQAEVNRCKNRHGDARAQDLKTRCARIRTSARAKVTFNFQQFTSVMILRIIQLPFTLTNIKSYFTEGDK
jgi:hypothetical protein